MPRVICNDCGYEQSADTLKELAQFVEDDDGILAIDYKEGTIDDFVCPDCGRDDAELEE